MTSNLVHDIKVGIITACLIAILGTLATVSGALGEYLVRKGLATDVLKAIEKDPTSAERISEYLCTHGLPSKTVASILADPSLRAQLAVTETGFDPDTATTALLQHGLSRKVVASILSEESLRQQLITPQSHAGDVRLGPSEVIYEEVTDETKPAVEVWNRAIKDGVLAQTDGFLTVYVSHANDGDVTFAIKLVGRVFRELGFGVSGKETGGSVTVPLNRGSRWILGTNDEDKLKHRVHILWTPLLQS